MGGGGGWSCDICLLQKNILKLFQQSYVSRKVSLSLMTYLYMYVFTRKCCSKLKYVLIIVFLLIAYVYLFFILCLYLGKKRKIKSTWCFVGIESKNLIWHPWQS